MNVFRWKCTGKLVTVEELVEMRRVLIYYKFLEEYGGK